ncbi:MAG TPA: insulinase family protein [Ruminococcaceae bacterium]|nr:insulinase family protein [Oscillospiraceae bacterium]
MKNMYCDHDGGVCSTEKAQRISLKPGIFFTTVKEEKFKYNHLSFNFLLPLQKETASLYALLPMVMRHGCKSYPNLTALNARLSELYGAQLDWEISKRGDLQILTFYIEILGDHFALENEELLEEGAKLLRDLLFAPSLEREKFHAEDVEIEKHNLADIIRSQLNDKRVYASKRLSEVMCEGEAYGLSEYGQLEDIEQISAERLTEAWHDVLQHAHVEAFYVGSGDAESVCRLFTQAFDSVKREKLFDLKTEVLHAPTGALKEVTDHLPVTQAKLGLGFRAGIALPDADTDAMQLACTVLGGSPHALLFLNVREKLSLCYYCFARYERYKGLVFIESGVEEVNAQKARKEILRQLDALKAGNFTEDDLKFAVLSLRNAYKGINDSLGTIAGWYLAQALAGQIRSPEDVAASLDKLTKTDVVRAAKGIALDTIYLLAGEEGAASNEI